MNITHLRHLTECTVHVMPEQAEALVAKVKQLGGTLGGFAQKYKQNFYLVNSASGCTLGGWSSGLRYQEYEEGRSGSPPLRHYHEVMAELDLVEKAQAPTPLEARRAKLKEVRFMANLTRSEQQVVFRKIKMLGGTCPHWTRLPTSDSGFTTLWDAFPVEVDSTGDREADDIVDAADRLNVPVNAYAEVIAKLNACF